MSVFGDDKGAPSPLPLRRLLELFDLRRGLPITSHRAPPIGPLLVAAKKLVRLASMPLLNELMRQQGQFNEQIVHLLRGLYRDSQALDGGQAALKERVRRLEDELLRLKASLPTEEPSDTDAPPARNGSATGKPGGASVRASKAPRGT